MIEKKFDYVNLILKVKSNFKLLYQLFYLLVLNKVIR